MGQLGKAIRIRRFDVKKTEKVILDIETDESKRLTFDLKNCSINGVGVESDKSFLEESDFSVGKIIPNAKLKFDDQEIALGRLVVKFVSPEEDGQVSAGFSLVDSKLPVEGVLSKKLQMELDDQASVYEFELSSDRFNLASFHEGAGQNIDLFTKCRQFNIFAKEWEKSNKYLYKNIRLPSKGVRVKLDRTRKNGRNDYVIMGSNDYYGLASHPEVLEASKRAIDNYGFGSTGSPVSTGLTEVHEELSEFISKLFRKEATLLFNSGYAANVGAISGIAQAQDLIVADIISHASIHDSLQMSNATARYFKHNRADSLQKILEENRHKYDGSLFVTEGVFSMDGDVPPLKELFDVARKYNCRTYVDEAHSFGVVGPRCLGAADKYGLLEDVDMIMGTFSKVCGGIGGFISGSKDVVNWLYSHSRAHLFSVSIPPSSAAAALRALHIFHEDLSLRENLKRNLRHFVEGMRSLGCPISSEHESTVIPVVIGDESVLGVMLQSMLDSGVFVVPVVYPAVSKKSCRFRFTVMANHSISDLDFVVNSFERAMEKANFSFERLAEQQAQTAAKKGKAA